MNITELIKSNEELKNLPFLVVFCTIKALKEKGLLKLDNESNGVDTI